MSSFMDNYESVADRIKRFWEKYPDGRIDVEIVEFNEQHQYAVIKASVYTVATNAHATGVDLARGNAANYPQNMKRWFVEDTTTSAIGRAIGLVLGTDQRSTKENMATVTAIKAAASSAEWPINEPPIDSDPWANKYEPANDEVQTCVHGKRAWREGEKDGRKWGGYKCPESAAGEQCDMAWYVVSSDGTWKPQVKK